jgi:hypothetical protein
MKCTVKIMWDEEAERWVASSSDVPGLVLESHSFELLLAKYEDEAAYFINENRGYKGSFQLSFETVRVINVEAAS